ncbi:MAG: hypothetical protein ACR2FY_23155 [Pirellulaceae bacterium]
MQTIVPLPNTTPTLALGTREAAAQGRVIALTRALFGGTPSIVPGVDPEYDEAFFVVEVRASGTTEEILQLNDQWHREVVQQTGDQALKFRLALNVE